MINPRQPELFAPERPVRSDFARRTPSYALRRVLTVLVLIGVITSALYIGFHHAPPPQPGQIPIIKADGNYKQRPAQPGGIDIPHQDVQVYQQLDNVPDKPEVEHLLPLPETPQEIPAPLPTQNQLLSTPTPETAPLPAAVTPPAIKKQSLDSIMAPDTVPAPPVNTTIAPTPVPAASAAASPIEPPVAAMQIPSPSILQHPAKPAPKTIDQVLRDVGVPTNPSPPPAGSGPAIQLAATTDLDAAQAMAQSIQNKYASILGPVKLHLVKADLGAKGIYYRIQSQPLDNDKANALCSAIKRLNAGCILVRR